MLGFAYNINYPLQSVSNNSFEDAYIQLNSNGYSNSVTLSNLLVQSAKAAANAEAQVPKRNPLPRLNEQ